jgi:hypothetical protein
MREVESSNCIAGVLSSTEIILSRVHVGFAILKDIFPIKTANYPMVFWSGNFLL